MARFVKDAADHSPIVAYLDILQQLQLCDVLLNNWNLKILDLLAQQTMNTLTYLRILLTHSHILQTHSLPLNSRVTSLVMNTRKQILAGMVKMKRDLVVKGWIILTLEMRNVLT